MNAVAPLAATDSRPSAGAVKATREDWIEGAMMALATEGVARVSILSLGERLGVSRSSFYWYFRDRAELLAALLTRWEALNTRSIVSQAQAPAATINEAVCNIFRCWVNPDVFSPRLDFAVREWARGSGDARDALDRADRERTAAIRATFARFGYEDRDALVRARVLYFTQIGYYALDIREPIAARLELTPHYLAAITGVAPHVADMAAFRVYAEVHAGKADFGPAGSLA